jgi:hypothetical protein
MFMTAEDLRGELADVGVQTDLAGPVGKHRLAVSFLRLDAVVAFRHPYGAVAKFVGGGALSEEVPQDGRFRWQHAVDRCRRDAAEQVEAHEPVPRSVGPGRLPLSTPR